MRLINRFLWYIKLMLIFMKMSLQSQLEYRLNFIAGISLQVAFFAVKLIYMVVVQETQVEVGGLSPDMVSMFIGIYVLFSGVFMFFSGIHRLPDSVRTGGIDMLMTKPASLQFLQSVSALNFFDILPNCAAGITIIVIYWNRIGIEINLANIAGFVFFILMGIVLTYAITLIPALLAFWVSSVSGIFNLYYALMDFNNMPMKLYPRILQEIGTFVIPIFVITNWSGLLVLGKLDALHLLWGIFIPIFMFVATKIFWNRSLKRYISANG